MQFDAFTFIVFFALVLGAFNALRGWGARKWLLLAASYIFYAGWNPPFVLLLIASTTVDWWVALRIDRTKSSSSRRLWVTATLLVNLTVLGYFKYSGFLLGMLAQGLARIGIVYHPPELDIILPIGISFYTFHSLSYCLDVYRRKLAPTRNWRDYALYVGFFPQLVAGPIVRWTQMGYQIETPRKTSAAGLGLGLALLTLGLFEKVVLADDVFAPVADALFNHGSASGVAGSWAGAIAFSGQIFCDFAGYSTCAIGAAMCLGFALPINFRNPYAAAGFSDFWRRWHISLSTWLRDYLYISLGGNREGAGKTFRNIMMTMLIGGLWHGAAWTFVAWGGLHGLFLVAERGARERIDAASFLRAPAWMPFWRLLTLLAVVYAWVWFRAPDFATGWMVTQHMVALGDEHGPIDSIGFEQQLAVIVFFGLVVVHWLFRNIDPIGWLQRIPLPALSLLLAVMAALIVLSPGETHAFIYFQF
ncbi:MAG: MBOAT family O-acyltransferase [Rhodanobacteraceae bacterium]